jgi:hypothetical protein
MDSKEYFSPERVLVCLAETGTDGLTFSENRSWRLRSRRAGMGKENDMHRGANCRNVFNQLEHSY